MLPCIDVCRDRGRVAARPPGDTDVQVDQPRSRPLLPLTRVTSESLDASWRRTGATAAARPYLLPELVFPADRCWLVSTLWDYNWTCVGGPVSLVDALLNHPDLRSRVRRVSLDKDATPPGHRAI